MTPDDLRKLAADGESERLELKSTTGGRREAAKTACAMLNHQGGLIIIGVTPDGKVAGQQVGNSTLDDLSQEFQEIDPRPFPPSNGSPLPPAAKSCSSESAAAMWRPTAIATRLTGG